MGVPCSNPENVWEECKRKVVDDPNEVPSGIVVKGEVAKVLEAEF